MLHNLKVFKNICKDRPDLIAKRYGLTEYEVKGRKFWYKDNGSKILGIAHTDSVLSKDIWFGKVKIPGDLIIYSPTLDDRAGVYTLLHVLPRHKVNIDVLLTEGEETGNSTGEDFVDMFKDKTDYNWMFQFDRGYEDIALYDYDTNPNWKRVIEEVWGKSDSGLFSDISFMEDLGISGMNVPTGYRDYHSSRAHLIMSELDKNIKRFIHFYKNYKNIKFFHQQVSYYGKYGSGRRSYGYYDDMYMYGHLPDYARPAVRKLNGELVKYDEKRVSFLYDCAVCQMPVMREDFYMHDTISEYCQDNGICEDCFDLYYRDEFLRNWGYTSYGVEDDEDEETKVWNESFDRKVYD